MWVREEVQIFLSSSFLFFKMRVEFKSSEFNHSISTLQSNKPIRVNVFSEAASVFLKSKMIAGLPSY